MSDTKYENKTYGQATVELQAGIYTKDDLEKILTHLQMVESALEISMERDGSAE
jgi:hypothetical protein